MNNKPSCCFAALLLRTTGRSAVTVVASAWRQPRCANYYSWPHNNNNNNNNIVHNNNARPQPSRSITTRRLLSSFTFAGPRNLSELLNTEKLADKPGTEVADLWYTYHEGKENVVGLVLEGERGSTVLERASKCPFFVQPVFRDDGYFMLITQFLKPSHFLLAYLEDYKMDPNAATPLLTFSVFTDYANAKQDVALVRGDILNESIRGDEGRKIVESVIHNYQQEFAGIQTFNERPAHFNLDEYISRMNDRWKAAECNDTVA